MTTTGRPGVGEADQSPLLADAQTARRPGTRAADGFERIEWTTDDVEAMARAGLLDDDARIELIEGELLPMPPKGDDHEISKNDLRNALVRALPTDLRVAGDSSLLLDTLNWYDPDIMIYPRSMKPSQVRGPDALLVVEVSDSSVRRDRKLKAPVYARCGVKDYWVIDTARRIIVVHRGPKADGAWTDVHEAAADEAVHPLALPDVTVRLADLLPEHST